MARTATRPAVTTPVVTAIEAGDPDKVVVASTGLDLGDDAQLFAQVQHKVGCPMVDAPLDAGKDGTPGKRQRMEHYELPIPKSDANPRGGTCIIVRCADCGNEVRID